MLAVLSCKSAMGVVVGVSKIQLGTDPNTTWYPRTREGLHLHLQTSFLLYFSPIITSNESTAPVLTLGVTPDIPFLGG